MPQIIGAGPPPGESRAPSDSGPFAFWPVLTAGGLALAAIGFVDLLLLWLPFDFGRPDWEFGAISAHFDGMALGTVGLLLLLAAALAGGYRRVARALAIVCWVIGFASLVLLVIYLLDVPIALRATGERMRGAMVKSITKTSIFAVVYSLLYFWLGWRAWRPRHH